MKKEDYISYARDIVDATKGLFQLAPMDKLDYTPYNKGMNLGQLMKHCATCMGSMAAMAMGGKPYEMPEGAELQPAEAFPSASSLEEVMTDIETDWDLMIKELDKISDEDFNTKTYKAPWEQEASTYLRFMLMSSEHLSNHKMQLFMYLKMLGKEIGTHQLYGMPTE